jgi:OOP family OmpA-OmpF porin
VLPAGREASPPSPGDPAEEDLASLREILLGPTEDKLRTLETRVNDRFAQARDISAVLPQALLQRSDDPELARALSPPVERAITSSVRRDPKPLADALFPVIGPAIRKAVAASLASMVESLNRTLEHSVSWRALQWRAESWRTGRPFGEIVLLNTLVYRVEQVFLIHRETGLLLQHVRGGPAQVEDAQIVSAMLTAIRDFVQDSFRVAEHDGLDAVKVGELSVWIEQGPSAVLAAVIRGTAPPELRQVLQRTLERIHLDFAGPLAAFSGDSHAFDTARPLLEDCLEARFKTVEKGRRRGALVLLGLIAVGLAVWAAFAYRDYRRWTSLIDALKREPGIVLISAERRGGRYVVSGLRDPLASDPLPLVQQASIDPGKFEAKWEPYQAMVPPFVLQRARQVLQPPAGVELTLQDGTLTASGAAPSPWIADARRLAPLVPGVTRFDPSPLLASRVRELAQQIESGRLLFVRGTPELVAGQEAGPLATALRELETLAAASGSRLRLEITGHTDSDGAPESNLPLSNERAKRALALLGLTRSPHLDIRVAGVGSDAPVVHGASEADKQQNRSVTFKVLPITPAEGVRK